MRIACRIVVLIMAMSLLSCNGIPIETASEEIDINTRVVILHGLKRSSWSMKKIERELSKENYDVCNIDYPSNRALANELVDHILNEIDACYGSVPDDLNFVTHSMGGIMVRAIQASGRGPKIKRVVMLAPPNHGSELVDMHRNSSLFQSLMGPIASFLGTGPGSLPLRLGPATFDVGIIAGTGKSNPLGLWVFNEPSDGTVSVASARLEGMSDFIEVPFGHTFIMRKQAVIDEIKTYLNQGSFSDSFR